jgi:uncharacterized protein YajQ (UPF0234 family)
MLRQGIDSENAKKITKLIPRDDLQTLIAMLKNADLDVAPQFVNYR